MQSLISFHGKYYKSFALAFLERDPRGGWCMITPKNPQTRVSQNTPFYAFVLRKLALHLHFLLPFTLISNLNKSPAVFVYGVWGMGNPNSTWLRYVWHDVAFHPLFTDSSPPLCLFIDTNH